MIAAILQKRGKWLGESYRRRQHYPRAISDGTLESARCNKQRSPRPLEAWRLTVTVAHIALQIVYKSRFPLFVTPLLCRRAPAQRHSARTPQKATLCVDFGSSQCVSISHSVILWCRIALTRPLRFRLPRAYASKAKRSHSCIDESNICHGGVGAFPAKKKLMSCLGLLYAKFSYDKSRYETPPSMSTPRSGRVVQSNIPQAL